MNAEERAAYARRWRASDHGRRVMAAYIASERGRIVRQLAVVRHRLRRADDPEAQARIAENLEFYEAELARLDAASPKSRASLPPNKDSQGDPRP